MTVRPDEEGETPLSWRLVKGRYLPRAGLVVSRVLQDLLLARSRGRGQAVFLRGSDRMPWTLTLIGILLAFGCAEIVAVA